MDPIVAAMKTTPGIITAGSQTALAAVIAIFIIAIAFALIVSWLSASKQTKSLEKIFDRLEKRDDCVAIAIEKLAISSAYQASATTALNENIKSNQFCPLQRVGHQ